MAYTRSSAELLLTAHRPFNAAHVTTVPGRALINLSVRHNRGTTVYIETGVGRGLNAVGPALQRLSFFHRDSVGRATLQSFIIDTYRDEDKIATAPPEYGQVVCEVVRDTLVPVPRWEFAPEFLLHTIIVHRH